MIKLGAIDPGVNKSDLENYIHTNHEDQMVKKKGIKLRGEPEKNWVPFSEVRNQPMTIKQVQQFLKDVGFFPFGKIDGVCGYRLVASMRLFQEYVSTIEGQTSIGPADAVFGKKTYDQIRRWQRDGVKADWVNVTANNPDPEYTRWMNLLQRVRDKNVSNPSTMLRMINEYNQPCDTVKVKDWDLRPDRVQIVGVRRDEAKPGARTNDDVFLLLINGLVFKFYGTTDPGKSSNDAGAPFLMQGQHKYRFGWHKVFDSKFGVERSYLALKPMTTGVLVIRSGERQNPNLAASDVLNGRPERNNTINIHWGGKGASNWSHGCQVICGSGYINHKGDKIDCSDFAATFYPSLGKYQNGHYMTKGAYTVMADLVAAFSGDLHAANYTLLYEKDLELHPEIGARAAKDILNKIS